MRFRCEDCGVEIFDISISKTYEVRDDYEQQRSSKDFLKGPHDREYFDSKVNALYYTCKCGKKVIRDNEVPKIKDFIRDSQRLDPNDLKSKKYGPLSIHNNF